MALSTRASESTLSGIHYMELKADLNLLVVCLHIPNPLHGVESSENMSTSNETTSSENPLHGVERHTFGAPPRYHLFKGENPLHGVERLHVVNPSWYSICCTNPLHGVES